MNTKKTNYLPTLTLVLSLLLSGGSAFAACDGSPAGEPGSACEVSTAVGTPLDGELVLNFTHFHCADPTPGACDFEGLNVAHVKATLRLNYSKNHKNDHKKDYHVYTFNAFLGKDVSIIDPCPATTLVIEKFTKPILKKIFDLSDRAASGVTIRLREPYPNNIDYTVDLNAKPGTFIFAPDDYMQEFPITSFTNVVDFKAVVLGL